jgi:tetratricopeptide (TPR) repeat protein
MSAIFDEVKTLQQGATLDRKRGEALRKAGREAEARQAFDAGIAKLQRAGDVLEGARSQDARQFAERSAENFGSLAGLLRRAGRNDEAYEHYVRGAAIEGEFSLATTYNRVNEIKYALSTGRATVLEVEGRARATADHLDATLRDPATQQLGDGGWAWADLGDCRGLAGELTKATQAYATFKAKASVQAPATALDVLQNLVDELTKRNDPQVGRVTSAMAALRSLIGGGASGAPRA